MEEISLYPKDQLDKALGLLIQNEGEETQQNGKTNGCNGETDSLNPGEGLILRPLQKTDFARGFPQILSQLTVVGDVSEEKFIENFEVMKNTPNTYYVTVLEDTNTGKIMGSATLFLEQKFIHGCGKRGRIEDVVVSDEYRGRQLGKLLITSMKKLAQYFKCYKLSLDCRDAMIPFYKSLGFQKEDGNGNFMVMRF